MWEVEVRVARTQVVFRNRPTSCTRDYRRRVMGWVDSQAGGKLCRYRVIIPMQTTEGDGTEESRCTQPSPIYILAFEDVDHRQVVLRDWGGRHQLAGGRHTDQT